MLKEGERLHPLQFGASLPIARERSVVNSTDHLSTLLTDMKALSDVSYQPGGGTTGGRLRLNEGLCRESDLAKENPRALALFNQNWRDAKGLFDAAACFEKHGCSRAVPPTAPIRQICDKISDGERKFWKDLFRRKCRMAWPDWYVRYNYRDNRFQKMKNGERLMPGGDDLDDMLKESVDQALEDGEYAAIGYDVSFMREKREGPESHWSSIVARRRGPDGKCYYGVRNSWGGGCEGYGPAVQCMKNGFLLVREDELLPRIHTVQHFGDPPPKPVWVGPALKPEPASFKKDQ